MTVPGRRQPEPSQRSIALPAGTIEALRQGDVAAFNAVYEAYRARLYTFLVRMARDEALARDLSQETWLRLAANAVRLAPDTDAGAWLFRVARNLFVSQRRWSLVQTAGLAALRGMLAGPAQGSPLEHVAAAATERRLERALAAMPLRYREVLLLISVEGFAAPEVAHMLALTPETVRQRLARGRAMLRRALEDGEPAAHEAS